MLQGNGPPNSGGGGTKTRRRTGEVRAILGGSPLSDEVGDDGGRFELDVVVQRRVSTAFHHRRRRRRSL